MFDSKKLLDQFLGSGGLDKTLSNLGLGQEGQTQRSSGTASQGSNALGGVLGGVAAGGLVSVLLGSKGGRKFAGKALTYGGLALVGGIAYKAYSDWQKNKSIEATAKEPLLRPPANSDFLPAEASPAHQNLSLALLRAMIAAAKADGHIDAQEQAKIFEVLGNAELDAEAKVFVMDELKAPLDIEAVAKAATSEEIAAEIYAASLLAINPEGAAEKGYLAMLAARLKLPDGLIQHLHASVDGVRQG